MKFNIGTKILLAVSSTVVLAFFSFILYFNAELFSTTKASLQSKIEEAGKLSAESISSWISGRKFLIENLAQNIVENDDEDYVRSLISRPILENSFVYSYLGSSAGKMMMFPNEELPADYDPRVRPWYKDASSAKKSALTEPYSDATSGALIVTVTTPVIRDNNLLGVVGGDIDIGTLGDIVRSVDLGGVGYAFLVNDKNEILIHPDKENTLKTMADVFPVNTPSIGTELSEANFDDPQIFTFFKVEGLPAVNWYLGFVVERDAAFSNLNNFRTTAFITALISVLAVIAVIWFLTSLLISKPVTSITSAMTRLSEGDLDVTVEMSGKEDEISSMAKAVLVFKENAIQKLQLESDTKEAEARNERERQVELNQLANSFEQEVGGIVDVVNEASNQLQNLAGIMSESAQSVGTHAEEASNAAHSITSNVESVAAASEELSTSISEISSQVSSSSSEAGNAAEIGSDATRDVQGLSDSVGEISQIVNLISDIADQTNLLALNATIEAARAGEAGKGFAVVASEVKSLASQTANATGQIGDQINSVVSATNETVAGIESINSVIGRIQETSSAIAAAVEEQGAATSEIASRAAQTASEVGMVSSTVEEVKAGAQDNVGRSNEVLTASVDLKEQANTLKIRLHAFLEKIKG